MAGYICKIIIENTHPPVWRRVIVPNRITFKELHEVLIDSFFRTYKWIRYIYDFAFT